MPLSVFLVLSRTARRICRQDPIIAKRIHFFVGLVCGHLKSKAYSDMLAWRAGFDPADMKPLISGTNLKTAIRMITGICVEDIVGKQVELVG